MLVQKEKEHTLRGKGRPSFSILRADLHGLDWWLVATGLDEFEVSSTTAIAARLLEIPSVSVELCTRSLLQLLKYLLHYCTSPFTNQRTKLFLL